MKYFFSLVVLALLLTGCGKKEEQKLTAYNAEAFAFSLDTGYEVNASVRVKGFKQEVKSSTHIANLSYTVDLITPEGKKADAVAKDEVNEENTEELSDVAVEARIELDSSYKPGKYKLIFNIRDQLSGQTATLAKDFELVKE